MCQSKVGNIVLTENTPDLDSFTTEALSRRFGASFNKISTSNLVDSLGHIWRDGYHGSLLEFMTLCHMTCHFLGGHSNFDFSGIAYDLPFSGISIDNTKRYTTERLAILHDVMTTTPMAGFNMIDFQDFLKTFNGVFIPRHSCSSSIVHINHVNSFRREALADQDLRTELDYKVDTLLVGETGFLEECPHFEDYYRDVVAIFEDTYSVLSSSGDRDFNSTENVFSFIESKEPILT